MCMNTRRINRLAHQYAAATLRVAIDNGELPELLNELDPATAAATLIAVGRLADRHAISGGAT